MPLKHLQHVQHPSIYFCNIHIKQLQHTSETCATFEIYACNMRFNRNISLLRSRIATAMASTTATTFWWGTAASAAPQHTRGTGHGAQQVGAQRAGAGAAGDGAWRDDGGRNVGWSATLDGGAARRQMGCATGKTATTST
jgi:hypothetical protein